MSPCLVFGIIPDTGFYLCFGAFAVVAVALLVCGKRLAGGFVGGIGILLLAGVVLPDIHSARTMAFRNACVANLKQIQDAKAQWAAKCGKSFTDIPADSDLFGDGAYLRDKPECPSGGCYHLGTVGQKASCSENGKGHRLE